MVPPIPVRLVSKANVPTPPALQGWNGVGLFRERRTGHTREGGRFLPFSFPFFFFGLRFASSRPHFLSWFVTQKLPRKVTQGQHVAPTSGAADGNCRGSCFLPGRRDDRQHNCSDSWSFQAGLCYQPCLDPPALTYECLFSVLARYCDAAV